LRGFIALLVACACCLLVPTAASAFGTIYAPNGYGLLPAQNAEHERITRHALRCAGPVTNACFEDDPRYFSSLDNLAGAFGMFGAVGQPDRPGAGLDRDEYHCDNGDYLDVPGYHQTEEQAGAQIRGCRALMWRALNHAATRALGIVDADGDLVPSEVVLPTESCGYAGYSAALDFPAPSGSAKCAALQAFGILLHAAQDFYSHTNWVDTASHERHEPLPGEIAAPTNPPGLERRKPAAYIGLATAKAPPFPDGLISGCFGKLPPSFAGAFGLPEANWCNYEVGGAERRAVKHEMLKKDHGVLPAEGSLNGQTLLGLTSRGVVVARDGTGDNFSWAVRVAVADTMAKWVRLKARIRAFAKARWGTVKGTKRARTVICALVHDDPMRSCGKVALPDLAGQWVGQDGGRFTLSQARGSTTVTWEACSADGGLTWQHDFVGTIRGGGRYLVGHFRDEPPGTYLAEGDLVLRIESGGRLVWVDRATIDGVTYTSFPTLTRTWTRASHAGCPSQGSSGGVFRITGVELPAAVDRNGAAGDLSVTWAGAATFPVTMTYAPDSCPPGLGCATVSRTFTVSSNPLVGEGAVWCEGSGFPSPQPFDYSVSLTDASGRRTERVNADFNCL